MHTFSKNMLGFALGLSALAGCVDAIGFLKLGGYFISFMSGNSTQLAVGLAQGVDPGILLLASIIMCFVAGAALGTLVSLKVKTEVRKETVLLLVTALLTTAALYYETGGPLVAMLIMTLAMGAENSTLRGEDGAMVGVTYMTGTLARVGQRIAHALLGGDKLAWAPYLLLWLGLIVGGVIGAILYRTFGLHSLWVTAIWAAALTAFSFFGKRD